jgi:hypothetical protein
MGGEMIKLKCTEAGCGAVIQMADSEGERLAARMAEHIVREHGSLELKHTKTLEACHSAFFTILSGGKVSGKQARQLHDAVSDLLSKPHAIAETEVKIPEVVEEEKTDGDISTV